MFALSRTWVEHDLFPMLSPQVFTDLQERNKEGLCPSSSTHVRESANMGHPSRGVGWWGAGKVVDEMTANPQTEPLYPTYAPQLS